MPKRKSTSKDVSTKKKTKLVETIKKVISKSAETKSYIGSFTLSPIDDGLGYCNLIYGMAQGTDLTDYIGTKIHIKNIHIKGQIFNATGASTNNNTKLCRVTIFKTKKALTNTSTAGGTTTDVFRQTGTPLSARGHVDLRKVTLFYDKVFTLTPPSGLTGAAGINTQKAIDIKINLNKSEYFDLDNSGYLKNGNYYLSYTCYDGAGVIAPTSLVFTYTVNFKDE